MIYPDEYFSLEDAINGDLTFFGSPARDYDTCDFIFMQFTGLVDKNGTEIYEDDIVKITERSFGDTWVASVSWGKPQRINTWYAGETWLLQFTNPDLDAPLYPYCQRRNGHEVEIIGNIYENPELVRDTCTANN